MNKTITLNIPITKVDEEQRIVTGVATSEALDSQGDIVDYEASKKAFSEWKGNIREMHAPKAIGKSIDVQFDDKNKQVILSAYISKSPDGENAWTKVKEGILTGFSIGGKIYKVTKDKAQEGASRVVDYALSETSLVDNPANPEAQLMMVKSVDGNLQRIEENVMKKSVIDAQLMLECASQIAFMIMHESMEGEPVDDLVTAFNALRDFAAKEVAEGDDFTDEYNEVIELAQTTINLRKDKMMADKKTIEKSNVTGGVERDENAEVVEDLRPAEVQATAPEVAPEAKEEVKSETSEEATESTEEEAKEDTTSETEEAPVEEKTEVKSEKKSDDASDLIKSVQSLIAKIDDGKSSELKKVADALEQINAKVEKFDSLEERVNKLEQQPLPTKAQASYAVVEKGETKVDDDVQDLIKRQEHLIDNPQDAKPGEMEQIFTQLRKARADGRLQ